MCGADAEAAAFLLPGTTLVVVPSSAMWQWKDEIERYWVAATRAEDGAALAAPRVLLYYEKRAKVTPEVLGTYDVVLTTYPILEYEYRAMVGKCKVACPVCGVKMLPRKLKGHLTSPPERGDATALQRED